MGIRAGEVSLAVATTLFLVVAVYGLFDFSNALLLPLGSAGNWPWILFWSVFSIWVVISVIAAWRRQFLLPSCSLVLMLIVLSPSAALIAACSQGNCMKKLAGGFLHRPSYSRERIT